MEPTMHLETAGVGPSLVLLHANGGDGRDFSLIAPRLAELGWKVTTIDWPGHGRSQRSDRETAVGFGELLASTLDGIGGRHVLLGNSVGGFAALHTAARRPDLVSGLVLVSPGGFSPRWPVTTLACRIIGTRAVAPHAYRLLPTLYLRERNAGVADAIARARVASQSEANAEIYASVWRSFADRDHDGRSLAASVHCPTMLAWGTRDPILPWLIDGRRARAALYQADVVTFDGAGHQPFIERPDEFVSRTKPFLDRLHATVPR